MLQVLQRKPFILHRLRLPISRLIKPICLAASMFFCMRAEFLLRASPLAAALMAAGLAAGESAAALAAGCLLGMIRIPLREVSLLPGISCVLALAAELILSCLPMKKQPVPETKCALSAGLCVLLPALISANGLLFPSLQALACALLAATAAPFLMAACSLQPGRKHLMFQEKLGLALAASAALAGIWQMLPPAGEFLAALLVLLLPGGWLLRTDSRRFQPVPFDPDHIAREVRSETRRRLRALGDAFSEMADECSLPSAVPDEQALIYEMRSRLCAGCAGYESCWTGEDNRGVHLLCQLIADALDRVNAPPGMRVLFSDGEIPPFILRACRRGRMIPDRLGLLLRDFSEKRRSEIKRCSTNQLMAVQFMQAREILYHLAAQQEEPVSLQNPKLEQLRGALESAGLGSCEILSLGTQSMQIQLSRPEGWTQGEIHRAIHVLNRAFGGKFQADSHGETLHFIRCPKLHAQTGTSCQSGIAGELCGDSHLIRMMDRNRLVLVLSDGMGSGSEASTESTEALRLLWCFLDAGISPALALETVNQRLLMKSTEEMFATMDLCILDLNTGIAEFTKFAACRTLILRGRELLQVEGGQLPLGILENVQPGISRIRLRPGDLLVMGSDGLMEAGDALLMEHLTREHAACPPQQLAETLVREAGMHRDCNRRDDLTCICLRVEATG